MKRLLQITLMAFVMTGLTTVALAQGQSDNADINANATVIAQLDVVAGNALDFGNVTPGISSSVPYGSGGTFSITGGGGASIGLAFTLPADLTSGTNNLDIVFGAGDANWSDTSTPDASNDFDPTAGTSLTFPADGDMTVFIGGTVNPTAGQAAGAYTGTITLTATYN